VKLHKRIFAQTWAQNAVSALAASYLRLVRFTGRIDIRESEHIRVLMDTNQPLIFCFWHGRLIPNVICWQESRILHILSTPHRDGQIAAKTYNRFNIQTIWGSTQKGGTEAVRKILKTLKAGGVIGITPDGPKGPRQRMQKSALDMARMSGAMLVPVATSITRAKWLNTWDHMLLPLPFGHCILTFGEPMEVPRKATDEEFKALRQTFEDRMNALTDKVDTACGHPTPGPAPLENQEGEKQ